MLVQNNIPVLFRNNAAAARIFDAVREILRAHGAPFENGVHLVCVLRWRAVEASYADLERDWRKAARKLKLQLLSREQDKT